MGPKKTKKNNYKKIDLTKYGYRGVGVEVPGLTIVPWGNISVVETPMSKDEERKKALESVFNLPRTSLSTILPEETDTEKNIVKEIIPNSSPSVLRNYTKDPFTVDRPPGSGPVSLFVPKVVREISQNIDFDDDNDFELMDIEEEKEEESHGGKRRHQKMKTRKASHKSKRKHSSSRKTKTKSKTKRSKTSVRRK